MDDGGVYSAFVHQGDGFGRGEVGDLPVRLVAGQAGSPGVDLGVDYWHCVAPGRPAFHVVDDGDGLDFDHEVGAGEAGDADGGAGWGRYA